MRIALPASEIKSCCPPALAEKEAAMSKRIRSSAIAGSWYPGDPMQLQSLIQRYLDGVDVPPIQEEIIGLISPHAGYTYSGQTAAFGYKQLVGKSFDTVVILSPMHHWPTARYHVPDADCYETPLGQVSVRHDLVDQVLSGLDAAKIPDDPEHSLEIQLPFLQVVLTEFDLVPIMIGHADVRGVDEIVQNLIQISSDRNILFIASSDLHHIDDYDAVTVADERVISALESYDLTQIRDVLSRRDSTVCGRVPISILAEIAQKLGATGFSVLDHRNSGDITGEKQRGHYTVGYLSGVFIR
jgi:AmmeMemoRadiSam system protein B